MEFEKFKDEIKNLGIRVNKIQNNINNEEATKTSLVLPFFSILGYDIFNPLEFVPEFSADVGIKKGEKVDYAIIIDGHPMILVEAKSIQESLNKHDSQLFRYFGTTTAKFGILTNGKEYRFFTDLEEQNKMDLLPFLTIDITNLKDNQIPEISRFHIENFDIDKITSNASELKYLNNIKSFLTEQMDTPSQDFVKFLVGEVYTGVKTKIVLDKFEPIIKKGFNQFINERVNEKLNAALKTSNSENDEHVDTNQTKAEELEPILNEIETSEEELEAFYVVRMVLKDTIDIKRIFHRDTKSYFGILLDDNNRKWILRLFINGKRKKIIFNDGTDKPKTIDINSIIDISNYSNYIIETVERIDALYEP